MKAIVWGPALAAVGAALGQGNLARPVKPFAVPPVAYYESKCGRCHGPGGSFYEKNFAAKYDRPGLKAVLKRMAEGPGGAPLADVDLDAQVAYHRAISANLPFFSLTKAGPVVKGETTAEKVTAKIAGKEVAVTLNDGEWSVVLPKGATLSQLVLTAEDIVFRPASSAVSQSKPKR